MKYVFYMSVVLFAIFLFVDKVELGGISLLLFMISGAYLFCKKVWKVSKRPVETKTPEKEVTVSVKVSASPDYFCEIAGVQYRNGDEVAFYGKVKIIDTDTGETELEIVKFVKWLVSNFGVKFIPVGFNVDTGKTLRTKKDWLAFLTEYIDIEENELYEEV